MMHYTQMFGPPYGRKRPVEYTLRWMDSGTGSIVRTEKHPGCFQDFCLGHDYESNDVVTQAIVENDYGEILRLNLEDVRFTDREERKNETN